MKKTAKKSMVADVEYEKKKTKKLYVFLINPGDNT